MKLHSLATAIAVSICALAAHADDAAHVELLGVSTRTVDEAALLQGRGNSGTPTTIGVEVAVPLEAEGRVPAVILLHGSAGVMPYVTEWRSVLAGLGIATVIVDSYSGRGIPGTISDQDRLPRLNAAYDAYAVLERLRSHPKIDADRVAVMGFSRGADAALFSALHRLQVAYGGGARFAGHVAFYPACTTRYRADTETDGSPILVLHGEADDYAPAGPCLDYVSRLKAAGRDAAIYTFPGAHHVFMWKDLEDVTLLKTAQTTRHCELEEGPDGLVRQKGSTSAFTNADACVERGAHVGYNQAAAQRSRQLVTDFLARIFRTHAR